MENFTNFILAKISNVHVWLNSDCASGEGYRLVIPVRFHFHDYEKTVNWLMKKHQVIGINIQGIRRQ